MKQRIIIFFALVLILLIVFFMVRDFYYGDGRDIQNPYEYDLTEFQKVDENQVCFEESGQLDPDMEKIKGVAVDAKDRIYIAGHQAVVVFDRDGEKVQRFETGGDANCIAVGHQGEIYLGMTDHIEVMDFSGNLLMKWEKPGSKALITSIALDDTIVYVADAGNRVVHQYSSSGDHLMEIGRRNKQTGEQGFIIPSPYFDILVGREDELWVVNPGMHALQSYNQKGEPVSSWNRTSMQLDGFSGCCNPSHIAMLSNGSFVTSEKGIERVKIHLPSGEYDCVVAAPEKFEPGTVGLDLAVDSEDRILVLDPKKKMVRVFKAK